MVQLHSYGLILNQSGCTKIPISNVGQQYSILVMLACIAVVPGKSRVFYAPISRAGFLRPLPGMTAIQATTLPMFVLLPPTTCVRKRSIFVSIAKAQKSCHGYILKGIYCLLCHCRIAHNM